MHLCYGLLKRRHFSKPGQPKEVRGPLSYFTLTEIVVKIIDSI